MVEPHVPLPTVARMWIVDDPEGIPVGLTFERWRHILRAHPELAGWRRSALVAIRVPTEIRPFP